MEFLDNCLSFPVNIFTGMMIIAALYWLIASFGLLDVDSLDLDMDLGDVGGGDVGDIGDIGGDVSGDIGGEAPDVGASGVSGMSALASLMFHLGLYGVPMTLILTFITLFGWLISYYGFHLALGRFFEPGALRYVLGVPLFAAALFVGAFLTSFIIRPMRPFFKKEPTVTSASICGRMVVVRSTQVTGTYGEAVYEEGGTNMLLDVRPAREGEIFKRGDKVVLLEYDDVRHLYTVISEDDFRGR